jgi:hypothetical protein
MERWREKSKLNQGEPKCKDPSLPEPALCSFSLPERPERPTAHLQTQQCHLSECSPSLHTRSLLDAYPTQNSVTQIIRHFNEIKKKWLELDILVPQTSLQQHHGSATNGCAIMREFTIQAKCINSKGGNFRYCAS